MKIVEYLRPELSQDGKSSFAFPIKHRPVLHSIRLGEHTAKVISCVVVRTCKVSVEDIDGVEHSTQVNAASLYEAVATALGSLVKDEWVGQIGTGLTTVRVEVLQPPVTHEVKMKDFNAWIQRKAGSPADMILRERCAKMLKRE